MKKHTRLGPAGIVDFRLTYRYQIKHTHTHTHARARTRARVHTHTQTCNLQRLIPTVSYPTAQFNYTKSTAPRQPPLLPVTTTCPAKSHITQNLKTNRMADDPFNGSVNGYSSLQTARPENDLFALPHSLTQTAYASLREL